MLTEEKEAPRRPRPMLSDDAGPDGEQPRWDASSSSAQQVGEPLAARVWAAPPPSEQVWASLTARACTRMEGFRV